MLGYKSARIRELEAALAQSERDCKALAEAPRLQNVHSRGRELILTFARGLDTFQYVTYSTMESDTNGLRKWANIP